MTGGRGVDGGQPPLARSLHGSGAKERVKQVSDKEIAVLAAESCASFLSTLTDDQLTEMRGFIESGMRDYQARQNKSSRTEPL
jgi:hypothetical protein